MLKNIIKYAMLSTYLATLDLTRSESTKQSTALSNISSTQSTTPSAQAVTDDKEELESVKLEALDSGSMLITKEQMRWFLDIHKDTTIPYMDSYSCLLYTSPSPRD